MSRPLQLFRTGLLAGLLAAAPAMASAQVEIATGLSQETTGVGQPVQLTISVEGARSAQPPRRIHVDGLDIRYQGQSTQVQVINMEMTMTTSFTYVVIPQKPGIFEIPELEITAAGQAHRTRPLQLEVKQGAVAPPSGAQPQHPYRPSQPTPAQPDPRADRGAALDEIAFAELIVPAESAYVGQTIPVEIRLHFDSRYQFEVNRMPSFSGEGFTVERLSEPVERRQNIDGVPFLVYVFHSAITPVKTGNLEIDPATLDCSVRVNRRSASPFDDFFGDFFGGGFGSSERRQLTLHSNPAELEVLPLPTEGRPESFAGAIGQFTLDGNASPAETAPGEPVTLQWRIEGRGNFHAITAPELTNADAWRTYPASHEFEAFDAIGYSGLKTFDIMMIATTSTDQTPGAEFSYFDPIEDKYVTLTHKPFDVEADGGKIPAMVGGGDGSQEPAVADAVETEPQGPEPARSLTLHRFAAVPATTEFWIANGAAAIGFAALLFYFMMNTRMAADAARKRQAKAARRKALHALEARELSDPAFASGAVECLRRSVGGEEAERWEQRSDLTADEREALHRLHAVHEELHYAPSSRAALSAQERNRVVTTLNKLEKSHED